MLVSHRVAGTGKDLDLEEEQGGRQFVREVVAAAAAAAARAAATAVECEWQASVALPRARLWIARFEARQRTERRRRTAAKRIRKRGKSKRRK